MNILTAYLFVLKPFSKLTIASAIGLVLVSIPAISFDFFSVGK